MDDIGFGRGDGGHCRVDLVGAGPRRRRWSRDEKAQIISDSFAAGASVSAVARRHGVSLGLLHHWRRLARQNAHEAAQSFVPLLASEAPSVDHGGMRAEIGVIEMEVCGVSIRLRGAVDGASLATVLAAVRGR